MRVLSAPVTIPLPPGAESAEDWEDGESYRAIYWPETSLADGVRVSITGMQSRSGDIWRCVTMWANCPELSAGEARMVAAGLLSAADELDKL